MKLFCRMWICDVCKEPTTRVEYAKELRLLCASSACDTSASLIPGFTDHLSSTLSEALSDSEVFMATCMKKDFHGLASRVMARSRIFELNIVET